MMKGIVFATLIASIVMCLIACQVMLTAITLISTHRQLPTEKTQCEPS